MTKNFPKQTDPTDSLDKDFTPGLAKAIRGYGCFFTSLVYVATDYLGLSDKVTVTTLMDIALKGIKAGKIRNDNNPINYSKPDSWWRMFIIDAGDFISFVGEYFGQKIKASFTNYGASKSPLRWVNYSKVPNDCNYVINEFKDSVCQHFVVGEKPVNGGELVTKFNPDPTLVLSFLISCRYIYLVRI